MRIIELYRLTRFEKTKMTRGVTLDGLADESLNIKIKELEDIYNMNVA